MAKKQPLAAVEIHQPTVEMIPLDRVLLNPDNPKKPMSKDRLKGLNRSLTEFGLRDIIKVAPHPEVEGSYLVLDGNTRIEELRKRTEDDNMKIPCLVHADLATREKITEFVLTFDRNVKVYDEDMVFSQLKSLVDAGEDVELLAELTNLPNLQGYLDNIGTAADDGPMDNFDPDDLFEQDTIVISASRAQIDKIRVLIKSVKGKMAKHERISKILQTMDRINWNDDDSTLSFLLSVAAQFKGGEINGEKPDYA